MPKRVFWYHARRGRLLACFCAASRHIHNDCCVVLIQFHPFVGSPKLPQWATFATAVGLGTRSCLRAGVRHGFAFARHDRARTEDAVAIDESIAGHKCFAVFDGHGGDMAAKLAQKLLPQQLESNLHKSKDKGQAAIDAFLASDQEIQKDLANEARVFSTGTSSGTVCCAALLQDKELILLNLGDCRAVVCESAKVAEKTADHSPDKNKEEKQRLVNLGVNIDGGCVDGQVQVSRALGDVTKSGCKISGLICRPEVTIVEVKDTATDGIWDALQERTALTTARKVLRETRSPEAAAQAVLQAAANVS